MQCPQCRSNKTNQDSVLEYANCRYCSNEFYPVSKEELLKAVQNATEIKLPKFKSFLDIKNIKEKDDCIIIYLDGTNGGKYKLLLCDSHIGTLKRKKSGSERNQFGSRWTNGTNMWPEVLQ